MAKRKDLFDESVMSFGEHLEALRTHLVKALLGLAIGVAITLGFGEWIVAAIRLPIDRALDKYSNKIQHPLPVTDDVEGFNFWSSVWGGIKRQFAGADSPKTDDQKTPELASGADRNVQLRTVPVELPAYDLVSQLHEFLPDVIPAPVEELKGKKFILDATSEEFAGLRRAVDSLHDPITLNVQEAFMTYIKVSLISGLILSSPWVFYQIWLFVAAGLYPHERKYVYTYLPMSIFLFLGGAAFCFFGVFPTVLDFLLDFNVRMGLNAQIRISEWINFAVLMPLLFGVSFQLPLVMLFLQKINVFQADDYRGKRKFAILAIAFISMVLTPTPDPASMLLMMGPMLVLYELGIVLCHLTRERDPLETAAAA